MKAAEKTVLITGGARRIGRALALHFAQNGWNVAIHYHMADADVLQSLIECVESWGQKAFCIQADLRIESEIVRVIPDAVAAVGPLSLLINNASIFKYDTLDTVTSQSWGEHLSANLTAPVLLMQAFAAHARDCERAGEGRYQKSIINILDQRIERVTPQFFSYTVGKIGLWAATQSAALALAPDIRVNAIAPGFVLKSEGQTDEHFDARLMRTPLQRAVPLADICAAAHFLATSSSITGSVLMVDSGQHLV